MKTFVFGRANDEQKGPENEHGTVAIASPSRSKAVAAFIAAKGERDARVGLVRLPRTHDEQFDEYVDLDGKACKRPDDVHIVIKSGETAAAAKAKANAPAAASSPRKRAKKATAA